MDFTTLISENVKAHTEPDGETVWALIHRTTEGRVQTALEGTEVRLRCSVAPSDTNVKVEWMLPDLSVVEDSDEKTEITATGELVIFSSTLSDSGLYHCMIRTPAGVDLMPLRLTVKELSLGPNALNGQKIEAVKGNTLFLPCNVTSVQPSQTVWYLPKNKYLLATQKTRKAEVMENGTLVVKKLSQEDSGEYSCATIPANTKHGLRFEVFKNGTFLIKNIQLQDRGQYLCTAQNRFGSDRMVITLAVQTEAPKIKPPKSTEIAAYLGKGFSLDCLASGKPPAQISWILPDKTFVRDMGTNGTLQIISANFSNKGDYKCIASNAAGADTITYHLHVAALPPSISEDAVDQVIAPPGVFYLFKPSAWMLPSGVSRMDKNDEGDYTCYAKNKLGKDERKVSVKVGPNAPKIHLKSPSLVTVKLGESARMSCQATGEPLPRIMWISPQNTVMSTSSDQVHVMENGTLVLNRVRLAHEGKYACVARNSAAEGKPEPRVWWITPYGQTLTTPYRGGRFRVHQNGSLELRGMRRTDEGRYMCVAKNQLGEASLLVELEVASLAEKPSFAVPNIEILPIRHDGGDLLLECPARGKPIPEFAWVLPNGTLLTNGTLRITRPEAADKGVYRCLAKNVAGQAEKRYSLEAGRRPMIRGSTGMEVHFTL
uniref:Ig-like domain-containing protein n=1 Tax=Cynoglossus semilaevis TaxID=244447 RepID=A0A3P8WDH2_CYNSE